MSELAKLPWAVLKFGGTSVARPEHWRTIGAVVAERVAAGERPIVVCSALSGVSDSLEALVGEAMQGRHEPLLQAIWQKHKELAAQLGVEIPDELLEHRDELRSTAVGISLVREVSPRLHARLLALGELMSSRLGEAILQRLGVAANWLDARQCLRAVAEPNVGETRRFLSATCPFEHDPALGERLARYQGEALITQGFIASDEQQRTVLLGRGGSDTSATTLAAKLGAVRCEIWTDVPGMYTADPRHIPQARLIRQLDYAEAQEIVSTGAQVLHPRCIAPARAAGLPIQVRCTQLPSHCGTLIAARPRKSGAEVKAVSVKRDVMLMSMATPGMWQQVGFLADVFREFKRARLSVDLVSTSEMNVTVSLDVGSNQVERETLDRLVRQLSPYCRARIIGPCAAISLVGNHIRAILHELAPVFELFEEQRVHLVSQAASDLNLSFVVDGEQADRLVAQLHELLFARRTSDPALGPSWQDTFSEESSPLAAAPSAADAPWWRQRRAELLQVARRHTPAYVYDLHTIDEAAARLTSLRSVGTVLYAMKANPHPEVLARLERAQVGFECVSPGEIDRLFSVLPELDPGRVLFTPNFAPRGEYEHAFERQVRVTLDNVYPVEAWPELFRARELFLRVDPGRGRGHHEHVRTAGATSKFGVSPQQLAPLAQRLAALDVSIVGLHAHIGSGIRTAEDWADTALFLAAAAERFPAVRVLDLGGGLGVPERSGQAALDLERLDALLLRFREAHPTFELWLEPGRFLVARAGVLLAQVTQTKQKEEVAYVGIDAGMNSLIRPALYGSYHAIVNLTRLDEPARTVANVVGPICESGDTLGRSRVMPEPVEGDVLLIATAGAYGRAMSSSYNLREPAVEVFLPERGASLPAAT